MPELQFDYPSWFILGCLLIGVIYAYILYSKKYSWGAGVNRTLAILRFAAVSFILFLLLNPLLKQLISEVEKPELVIVIDNSLSITNSLDSVQRVQLMAEVSDLVAASNASGFATQVRSLNQSNVLLSDIAFDQKTTDLNAMFKELEILYDGKNLASVVLVSDGNYNRGISPGYFPYSYKISTIGVGDTTSQEDVVLKNVLYNKIAYQGNKFPLVAEVANSGFKGESAKVMVKKGGRIVASEVIAFDSENGLTKIEFKLTAEQNGVQHYTVQVELQGEEIIENNRKDVFIDVIDGKQKILLIAPAPHPDIKAFRSVIESNENYDFQVFIPGSNELKEDKYDLVIAHQAGDRYNRLAKYVAEFKTKKVPVLNVIGQQSNVDKLSTEDGSFDFKSIRNQRDEVAPVLNNSFSKFKINTEFNDVFSQFPTLNVPYGDLQLSPNADVLLYQKVGSITTDKPLLYMLSADGVKTAYLLADGIWQWRLQEYASNENTKAFDDVFLKLVQYLSTKEDKRKFRIFTTQDEYFDNEPVSFETETYNDSYERIYGNTISIKVSDDAGSVSEYSFIPSMSNTTFQVSGLDQGIYTYEATTDRNGQTEKVRGRFTVKKLQLELLDQKANFSLLRQIAENTEGSFYTREGLGQLSADLAKLDSKGIMHSTEDFFAMINLKWLFFLVLILLSTEWFVRKYSGGY